MDTLGGVVLPAHCPMFFDGYMCRESTPANEMFEVNCSRVHHLFNHSSQFIRHKCLHNNSWESGWNHTPRNEGLDALDTSQMLYGKLTQATSLYNCFKHVTIISGPLTIALVSRHSSQLAVI